MTAAPGLHGVVESDYTGWWFCLIPREVITRVGLPLPLFLKFDDAEFGLRARAAGIPTIGLPGVAVWHEGWAEKDPTRTGRDSSSCETRSSPDSCTLTVGTEGCFRFGHCWVMSNCCSGCSTRPFAFATRRSATHFGGRAACRGASAPVAPRCSRFSARIRRPDRPNRRVPVGDPGATAVRAPADHAGRSSRSRLLLRHLLVEPRADSRSRPEDRVPLEDARWWRFRGLDSALVEAPHGGGWTFAQRDRGRTVEFIRRSVRLSWQLSRAWPRLAREYRSALPELSSHAGWSSLLGEPTSPPQ